MSDRQKLTDTGSSDPASKALDELVAELRHINGEAVNAVLFYGSCLRSNNPFEGIIDLYLIVDSYPTFYGSKIRAFGNWLLPPNVFYKEFNIGTSTLRVKYNVLSIADLRRGLSGQWMHSYFWGRFSQPVKVLWCRDENLTEKIAEYLHQATTTFLGRVLPVVPESGTVSELWEHGMRLSYSAELRSEGQGRAKELIDHDLDHYLSATKAAISSIPYEMEVVGDGRSASYRVTVTASSRLLGRVTWAIRRLLGKALSLARLVKALFTFDGGLDYAVWKLERHTGKTIEIPDRVRRYPLIFVWPLLWRLYRRGVIR